MKSSFFALHEYVIDVDFYVMIDLILKDPVDQSLISSSNIFEIERHDFIAVQAFVNNKYHFFLIFGCHPDLTIAGEGIHEVELLMV